MVCTIYSHYIGFERIIELVKEVFPKSNITFSQVDDLQVADIEIKSGFFGPAKKIKMPYRQRLQPSYQLPLADDSALTKNLKGLYGYVNSLPSKNQEIRERFLNKIATLNMELSIIQEAGETKELKELITTIAKSFDAILFVKPNTIISKAGGQHFLDKDLKLIIDQEGNCEISKLDVFIDQKYFDKNQDNISEDQIQRKLNSESILENLKIKINKNLPYTSNETGITIRPAKEIAQRISVLAVTNLVAFNHILGEEAIEYLKKHNLWDFTTPKEKFFLSDPTEEKKNYETWKCECIWVLAWALNKINELGPPANLCELDSIPAENYPVGKNKDPNEFINSINDTRPKSEILAMQDLYYRIDWACVDARIKNIPVQSANPSLVYERHYALNWLINYHGQDWDEVSCDT